MGDLSVITVKKHSPYTMCCVSQEGRIYIIKVDQDIGTRAQSVLK